MNLHGIVRGVITSVNPDVPLSIRLNQGWTTSATGKRTPILSDPIEGVYGQIQSLTFRDLTQIEGLNLQGTRRAIYINGAIDGLVRQTNQGGDLVTTPDGVVWLVAIVLEHWPDWVKCAVTQQNGS